MISEFKDHDGLEEHFLRKELHTKYKGALATPESGTPAFWTNFWRDFYTHEPAIKVPQCRWSEKAIREPMLDISGLSVPTMLVLVPRLFQGGAPGLLRLIAVLPTLSNSTACGGSSYVEDTHLGFGYVKTEATLDAPNINTTQDMLLEHGRNRGYLPQREVTNLLQGRALFILTGEYPDCRTVSRLLGSREYGFFLNSQHSVNTDEQIYVNLDYQPELRNEYFGGRFEKFKGS